MECVLCKNLRNINCILPTNLNRHDLSAYAFSMCMNVSFDLDVVIVCKSNTFPLRIGHCFSSSVINYDCLCVQFITSVSVYTFFYSFFNMRLSLSRCIDFLIHLLACAWPSPSEGIKTASTSWAQILYVIFHCALNLFAHQHQTSNRCWVHFEAKTFHLWTVANCEYQT